MEWEKDKKCKAESFGFNKKVEDLSKDLNTKNENHALDYISKHIKNYLENTVGEINPDDAKAMSDKAREIILDILDLDVVIDYKIFKKYDREE